MSELVIKAFKIFLLGFLAIVGLALVLFVMIAMSGKQSVKQQEKDHAKLVKRNKNSTADSDYVLQTADIPTTQDARQESSPMGLLPSKWAADSQANDGSVDAVSTPAHERELIGRSAIKFVKAWETFAPSETARNKNAYKTRLIPFVMPGYINEVVARSDNIQSPRICPQSPGCSVASKWENGQITAGTSSIRYFKDNEAYLTMQAVVDYYDDITGKLDNTRWLREYGLLMRKYGSEWRVYRVAANTVSQM